MSPNVVANPTEGKSTLPLKLLLFVTGILAARWIWFAGIGDYGWTYELGVRVMQGEVPYRDYLSTLPQLTSYTIIPFIWALQGNLWAFALHLYFWWLVALLVGWQVVRAFGLRPVAQAAALFFAACLSLPALQLGHAYSYAATACFGLVLLQLLQHRRNGRGRHLVFAGGLAGLCLFAKQNIGAVAVLLGAGATVAECLVKRETRISPRRLLFFCGGVALTFLPIFAYFACHAGVGEVFQQMFSDAGAGKGGVRRMLFNLIPLWFFVPGTPGRWLWTFGITAIVMFSFLGFLAARMFRAQANAAAVGSPTARNSWRVLAAAIGIVVFLSGVSLFDLPSVRDFFARGHPAAMYAYQGYTFPLFFIAYAFFTALAIVGLLTRKLWREPKFTLLLLAFPLILWGHEMSCEGYLPFGAPLVVPLAMVLLESTGLVCNTVPLSSIAGAVMILGLSVSTQPEFRAASFKPLERLPADSKFAGIWASPNYVARLTELHEHVTPRIRDHTTLWICVGDPHLAWGGRSTFSVPLIHLDTYNIRSEPALMQHWQTHPPEFVFVGYYLPPAHSHLLNKEAVNTWLPERYDLVWQSPVYEAVLWQLRPETTNVTTSR